MKIFLKKMRDKNEEQLLIEKIREGNVKAEREVYMNCREYFLTFISSKYPILAEREVHLDVYQEVMMIFYENVKNGKLMQLTSRISTYLTRVGLFQINNIVRKLNKEQKFLDDYEISEFEHTTSLITIDEKEILEKELYDQLGNLDESCQYIIRLSFFERLSNSKIAEKLNISIKKVAQKKWTCLEKLRTLFHKNFKTNE